MAPATAGLLTDDGVPEAHVDAVAASLAAAGFPAARVVVPCGEAQKSLARVAEVCEAFARAGLDRGSPIVAVGGGVVTDLGGLVASLLFRGVPWAAVPTTLCGQVDAAVGGKTGVNLPSGKNLAGAFWQPSVVLADIDSLATLSARELRAGLAEVVKCAVIADAPLFARLHALAPRLAGHSTTQADLPVLAADPEALAEAVRRAVAVKALLVAADERETGNARRLLNFGHTVGHALESASGFALRHGEAVALGMVAAARVSARLGVCAPEIEALLCALLSRLGLPTDLDDALARLPLGALAVDKKRSGGKIQFVAVETIGRAKSLPIDASALVEMLRGHDRA